MKTVALCITHAAFVPERVKSMERLREQLHLADFSGTIHDSETDGEITVPNFGRIMLREETGRAPHHVWSRRQWDWGAKTKANLVVFLQDDAVVAPNFWQRMEEFVYSNVMAPDTWLSLLTNHHGARAAFLEGFSGYTTCDGVNGVGYATTPRELARLTEWIDTQILPGTNEKISEDVLAALYVMAQKRKVTTLLPGIIDHDLSVGTLHPSEHGANRRAYVRWDDVDRRAAERGPGYLHLGRYFATAHTMLPGVLLDTLEGLRFATHLERQTCPWPYNRFFESIVAQENWP